MEKLYSRFSSVLNYKLRTCFVTDAVTSQKIVTSQTMELVKVWSQKR